MLSSRPQHVSENIWYYEDKKGLDIYVQITDSTNRIKVNNITIPWKKIVKSLSRYRDYLINKKIEFIKKQVKKHTKHLIGKTINLKTKKQIEKSIIKGLKNVR